MNFPLHRFIPLGASLCSLFLGACADPKFAPSASEIRGIPAAKYKLSPESRKALKALHDDLDEAVTMNRFFSAAIYTNAIEAIHCHGLIQVVM